MQPQDLLFAKTHEWTHLQEKDGHKIATVGISHFAVEALTDLVYLELPQIGRQVKAGESFGEIESVKAVSDLYSPVTGEVVDVNRTLPERLEKFQDDPYGEAWIAKIRITDEAPLKVLLDYKTYEKQCAEEQH
ncbi:MAG: glycine cleavage system protein GcvH [Pirellulales bacterium]